MASVREYAVAEESYRTKAHISSTTQTVHGQIQVVQVFQDAYEGTRRDAASGIGRGDSSHLGVALCSSRCLFVRLFNTVSRLAFDVYLAPAAKYRPADTPA